MANTRYQFALLIVTLIFLNLFLSVPWNFVGGHLVHASHGSHGTHAEHSAHDNTIHETMPPTSLPTIQPTTAPTRLNFTRSHALRADLEAGHETPGYDSAVFEIWVMLMSTFPQASTEHSNGGARLVAALVSATGLVVAAIIIGFVVDAVMDLTKALRKGRSAVREYGHVVLIGWTDLSIAFISQICIANKPGGGTVIVVLADYDNEWMQDILRNTLPAKDLHGTKVIFRSGDPLSVEDLGRAGMLTHRTH